MTFTESRSESLLNFDIYFLQLFNVGWSTCWPRSTRQWSAGWYSRRWCGWATRTKGRRRTRTNQMQNPYPRTNIHNTIHSWIEHVRIVQQFIEKITNATLDNRKLDKEAVARLLVFGGQGLVDISDPDTRLSLDLFMAADNASAKSLHWCPSICHSSFPELSDRRRPTDLRRCWKLWSGGLLLHIARNLDKNPVVVEKAGKYVARKGVCNRGDSCDNGRYQNRMG